MRLQHKVSGDVLEVPPPDWRGYGVVRFNGRIVEKVLYSDKDGGTTTTEDGRVFHGEEWALYLVEQMRIRAWENS